MSKRTKRVQEPSSFEGAFCLLMLVSAALMVMLVLSAWLDWLTEQTAAQEAFVKRGADVEDFIRQDHHLMTRLHIIEQLAEADRDRQAQQWCDYVLKILPAADKTCLPRLATIADETALVYMLPSDCAVSCSTLSCVRTREDHSVRVYGSGLWEYWFGHLEYYTSTNYTHESRFGACAREPSLHWLNRPDEEIDSDFNRDYLQTLAYGVVVRPTWLAKVGSLLSQLSAGQLWQFWSLPWWGYVLVWLIICTVTCATMGICNGIPPASEVSNLYVASLLCLVTVPWYLPICWHEYWLADRKRRYGEYIDDIARLEATVANLKLLSARYPQPIPELAEAEATLTRLKNRASEAAVADRAEAEMPDAVAISAAREQIEQAKARLEV